MSSADRTIEIVVSPAGGVRILTRGYAGGTCRDATRALERALGVVQSDRPTQESYESPRLDERQDERQ